MRIAQRIRRLSLFILPFAGALAGWASRPAPVAAPGGHEVFCSGGQEIHERWPAVPPGGVPWQVAAGVIGAETISPGFPPHACSAGVADAQRPGVQSIVRAASAWTDVKVPFPPGPGGQIPAIPLPWPAASAFKFGAAPAAYVTWASGQSNVNRMVLDGVNLITCWQSRNWWINTGGPATIAAAFVHLSTNPLTPGDIMEGDIALNARYEPTAGSGRPSWCFLETNDLDQRAYATHTFNVATQPFQDPITGWCDFQGVVTHELGHVTGLGHSLVDADQPGAAGRFPTMFASAQVEALAPTTLSFVTSTGCPPTTYLQPVTNAALTKYGGILGRPARGLEIDDVMAIADTYPTTAFTAFLGSISGTTYLGSLATPENGVSIVAFREDSPDLIRLGTISYAGGAYTLRGLPPGNYYVYAEPVDQNPPPYGATGYYFNGAGTPNYVYQGPSGCTGLQTFFTTEFWDAAESFAEASPAAATFVTVQGGQTVTGIDFHLVAAGDMLTARRAGIPRWSPRGVVVSPQGGAFPNVEVRIQAPAAWAGQTGILLMALARASGFRQGQILQVDLSAPLLLSQPLDAAAMTTFVLPTSSAAAFSNWFFQGAAVDNTTGALRLSNSLNVWIASF